MNKTLLLIFPLSFCLWAADFWTSKPFTEWNEKEVQKLLNNSPWSKEVSVSMPAGGPSGSGRSRRGGGGGGGGGDLGDAPSTLPAGSSGGGNGARELSSGGGGAPSLNVIVSWRTALPLREAIAKQKYGADAGTSADAKKMIEEPQKFYAVLVGGLPVRMMRGATEMKQAMLENTTIAVKGKDTVKASDLQTASAGQQVMVVFLFPKTMAIDADDKEVEFSSKIGPMTVKQKFKLKEMMFNGKLEL